MTSNKVPFLTLVLFSSLAQADDSKMIRCRSFNNRHEKIISYVFRPDGSDSCSIIQQNLATKVFTEVPTGPLCEISRMKFVVQGAHTNSGSPAELVIETKLGPGPGYFGKIVGDRGYCKLYETKSLGLED